VTTIGECINVVNTQDKFKHKYLHALAKLVAAEEIELLSSCVRVELSAELPASADK